MALPMDDIIDAQISQAVGAILKAYKDELESEAYTVFSLKSLIRQAAMDFPGFYVALVTSEDRATKDAFMEYVGMQPFETVPEAVKERREALRIVGKAE